MFLYLRVGQINRTQMDIHNNNIYKKKTIGIQYTFVLTVVHLRRMRTLRYNCIFFDRHVKQKRFLSQILIHSN